MYINNIIDFNRIKGPLLLLKHIYLCSVLACCVDLSRRPPVCLERPLLAGSNGGHARQVLLYIEILMKFWVIFVRHPLNTDYQC